MTTTPERTATFTELVAAEIRAWLGRLDVRPAELARRLGENDQWLSTRLKGRTPINVNDMHRIAHALGLRVDQVMPPPDVAATAVIPPKTTLWQSDLSVRPPLTDRPKDNRPSGRPGAGVATGATRTGYVDRPKRRRRDR